MKGFVGSSAGHPNLSVTQPCAQYNDDDDDDDGKRCQRALYSQGSAVQCRAVQRSTVQHSAVQGSTVQYRAVQYSAVQGISDITKR